MLARSRRVALLTLGLFVVISPHTRADFITPLGLNPGEQFRVVFQTSSNFNISSRGRCVGFQRRSAQWGEIEKIGGGRIGWKGHPGSTL
jgi:hypothetical protein